MIEKLTVEKVRELKMTAHECVKHYFPNHGNQFHDFVIWEKTSFPFGGLDEILNQLYDLYKDDSLREDLPTDL